MAIADAAFPLEIWAFHQWAGDYCKHAVAIQRTIMIQPHLTFGRGTDLCLCVALEGNQTCLFAQENNISKMRGVHIFIIACYSATAPSTILQNNPTDVFYWMHNKQKTNQITQVMRARKVSIAKYIKRLCDRKAMTTMLASDRSSWAESDNTS